MSSDQFVVFAIRSTNRVIECLYRHVDAHAGLRVEVLADKIISEYVDTHKDDKMLTCYIGENKGLKATDPYWVQEKRYNLQLKASTLAKLRLMADDFNEPVGTLAKTALRLWLLTKNS